MLNAMTSRRSEVNSPQFVPGSSDGQRTMPSTSSAREEKPEAELGRVRSARREPQSPELPARQTNSPPTLREQREE